jgi:SAM-dependent methyltransferase
MSGLRSRARRLAGQGLAGPKITRSDIQAFQDSVEYGTSTLVAYADLPVPDAVGLERVPDYKNAGEVHRYLDHLRGYDDASFDTVISTGLLEHLPDPGEFLVECARVLRPDGRLYVRVSSVFPVHVGPDDYFHMTPFGLELLLVRAGLQPLSVRGSSPPFRTLAILTQRILLQCSVAPVARPLVRGMVVGLPYLDRFVRAQYMTTRQEPGQEIQAFMPSNIEAVATKSGR